MERNIMIIYHYLNGDELHYANKSLIIKMKGKRNVLSTAPHNGGYQQTLETVFNYDCKPDEGEDYSLKAPTYQEHMIILSSELGLNPNTTAGLLTAANMENRSIQIQTYEDLTVVAVVTGGIEVNGGRVGDPASFMEREEEYTPITAGTINIMLSIHANLSQGAIARALVTCTEAKTAAIQELLAPSKYSMGLATGSGTDGSIIITDPKSKLKLTNAGKHSKLGELIGKAVKKAVKEALKKQTKISPNYQHHILRRMDRFGINQESLWKEYKKITTKEDDSYFIQMLNDMAVQDHNLTYTSLYAHLIDQLMWGMISTEEAILAGNHLISVLNNKKVVASNQRIAITTEETIQVMINKYRDYVIQEIIKSE